MSVAEDLRQSASDDAVAAECVAFVGDNQTHGTVSTVLQQYFAVPVIRDGGAREALAFLAEAPAPQVLIVDTGSTQSPLADMLSIRSALPDGHSLIGIGEMNDIGLYRDMMDGGIADYLTKPLTEKALSSAILRTEKPAQPAEGERPPKAQQLRIAVIGSRGGVGSSTLAVNLAWLLAEQRRRKTALIDLDLEFGTIALSLDIEPTRGLREALENPARIDSLFVSSATAKVSERLSVMATEEMLTGEIEFNPAAVDVLLEALGRNHEIMLIDVPRPTYGVRRKLLELASHIVLVTELTLPGLRDAIRLLNSVKELGRDTRVVVVANRTGGKAPAMQVGDFQKALGHKVDVQVPDLTKLLNQAANLGKPAIQLGNGSKLAKPIGQIADRLEIDSAGGKAQRGGIWRGLLKRG